MSKQKPNYRIREIFDTKTGKSKYIIERRLNHNWFVRFSSYLLPLYDDLTHYFKVDETNTLKEASALLEIYKKGRFQEIIH